MMTHGLLSSAALGAQLVMAVFLLAVACRAWRRTHGHRMGWLALAFLLFFLDGLVAAAALLDGRLCFETATVTSLLLQAGGLLAIYLGMLRT